MKQEEWGTRGVGYIVSRLLVYGLERSAWCGISLSSTRQKLTIGTNHAGMCPCSHPAGDDFSFHPTYRRSVVRSFVRSGLESFRRPSAAILFHFYANECGSFMLRPAVCTATQHLELNEQQTTTGGAKSFSLKCCNEKLTSSALQGCMRLKLWWDR